MLAAAHPQAIELDVSIRHLAVSPTAQPEVKISGILLLVTIAPKLHFESSSCSGARTQLCASCLVAAQNYSAVLVLAQCVLPHCVAGRRLQAAEHGTAGCDSAGAAESLSARTCSL